MSRCPFALFDPDGATPGGKITPRVLIFHVTATDFDAHPHSGLEWHFEIPFDGTLFQLVDTNRRADANNKANPFAISVETWGTEHGLWTPAQLTTMERLTRWCNAEHDIPLSVARKWDGRGLGYHTLYREWYPKPKSCPGPNRKRQFHEDFLPRLLAPVMPPPPAIPEFGEDYMATILRVPATSGPNASPELYFITDGRVKWSPSEQELRFRNEVLKERVAVCTRQQADLLPGR